MDLRVHRHSACRSFDRVRHGGTHTLRIYASPEPVIGPINGPAVGIGATIQLPMDILRVNATRSEIERGLLPIAVASEHLEFGLEILEGVRHGSIPSCRDLSATTSNPISFCRQPSHGWGLRCV